MSGILVIDGEGTYYTDDLPDGPVHRMIDGKLWSPRTYSVTDSAGNQFNDSVLSLADPQPKMLRLRSIEDEATSVLRYTVGPMEPNPKENV